MAPITDPTRKRKQEIERILTALEVEQRRRGQIPIMTIDDEKYFWLCDMYIREFEMHGLPYRFVRFFLRSWADRLFARLLYLRLSDRVLAGREAELSEEVAEYLNAGAPGSTSSSPVSDIRR